MAIERLSHFGPEIHFDIKPVTIPTKISRRPLLLMGVAKYIVDIFDSDGALDSDALFTGPASCISAKQVDGALGWGGMASKTIAITLGGILKTVIVTAVGPPTTAAALVAYLNLQFAADAATGFAGVEFGLLGTTNIALSLKSLTIGDSVTMVVESTTHTDFQLDTLKGRTLKGFGNYKGYDLTVPFESVPDPQGILDYCVLDSAFEATIQVSVNRGDRVVSLSKTEAWERTARQRTAVAWAATGTGAPADGPALEANMQGFSDFAPFMRKAATLEAVEYHPWQLVAGETYQFWCPGRDASVNIPGVSNAGYLTLSVAKNVEPTALVAKTTLPATPSELNDLHGDNGIIYVYVQTNAGADTLAFNPATRLLTIQVSAGVGVADLDDIVAVFTTVNADSTHALYRMFDITLTGAGATLVDDPSGAGAPAAADDYWFFWDGLPPVAFDTSASACKLVGNLIFDDVAGAGCATLAGDVTLHISVDGSPVEKFTWPATTTVEAVAAAFNLVFGTLATFSFKDVSYGGAGATHFVAQIEGVEVGRAGTIYIPFASGLEHLFVVEEFEVTAAEIAADANDLSVVYTPAVIVPALFFPGGALEDIAGEHPIRYVRDNTAGTISFELVDVANPALAPIGAATYNVHTGLSVDDYIGVVHYGYAYPELAGDEVWENDVFKAMIVAYVSITNDGAVAYGNIGLQFSEAFGSNEVFEFPYTRVKNITSTAIGVTKPEPELQIDTLNDVIEIRNESVVNDTGDSYIDLNLSMYCGFEAVRLDITAQNMTRALTFTTVDDILEYGPIDPRNELIFGCWMAYQGMQLASEYIPFKALGIAGDTLADWQEALSITEKDVFWMPIALTDDNAINSWLGNYVIASGEPTRKKDWRTILYVDTPDEAFATTIGTGLTAATNGAGMETVFEIELDKLNVGAALIAMGFTPPGGVTEADGLYIQISGGGSNETEATYRWLIKSVNPGLNTVTVTITPTDTVFYRSANPPEVTSATITIYERGATITSADDKGTALQAYSSTFADARVAVCPNGGVDAPDYNGTITRLSGYFGLATLAGYIQTHEIENPVSGWMIPHLTHVYETDELYDEIDSIMRLFFLVNDHDAGTVEVGMDFTTDDSAVKLHRATVGYQLDALAIRIRDSVSSWKKMSISQRTLETLYAQVQSAGDATVQEREIARFDLDTIELGAPDFSEGGNPNQTVTDIEAVTIYGSAETFIPVGKLFIYVTV